MDVIFLTAIGFTFLMVMAGVVAAIGCAVYLLVWLARYYGYTQTQAHRRRC